MALLDRAPILICYDRSASARHAIDYAGTQFPHKPALVLNVWSAPVELVALGRDAGVIFTEESQQKLALEHAEEGCEIARNAGLVPTPVWARETSTGTAGTILEVADQHGVGVIVAGARGLGVVSSLFLGSVSHGVVHHAHRSVLVVPMGSDAELKSAGGDSVAREHPILACFDGSPGARHAIDELGRLLPTRSVLVLSIWSSPVGMAVHSMGREARKNEKRQKQIATASAAEGADCARQAGLDAVPLTASGSSEGTCRAILDAADERDARLIVLGARALGGIKALLLGSVSECVVRHARRAVLVVHAETLSSETHARR